MKAIVVLGCALWLCSCNVGPPCDPGQRYELGSCLLVPQDASTGDDDAGDAVDRDAQADAASTTCKSGPGHYEGFGRSCTTDDDCTDCSAPTCATAPINRCTRVQCQNDPQVCPPDWTCTDISAFSTEPSVTHICLGP